MPSQWGIKFLICEPIQMFFSGDKIETPDSYICDPEKSAKCDNGGFPHPRDCNKCICPGGYGGPLCNQLPNDCEQGVKVEAEDDWEELTAYVQNLKDDGSYATCTYWITAPSDKKIEIKIESIHSKDPTIGCAKGGVEIKANANHTLTGYRYCVEPEGNFVIKSHSNRVPVILYSGVPVFVTMARLEYRYVN
ncbi:hypothetical protein Y032_0099g3222 [Ancylostoma ceylanicum]|nr:hypothetical protein Y032_0099g3222 [Ancylostoma ceylanicum]